MQAESGCPIVECIDEAGGRHAEAAAAAAACCCRCSIYLKADEQCKVADA